MQCISIFNLFAMSIPKKIDNKIFQLSNPHSQATFALDDTVLTVELVSQGSSKVYCKTFTPQTYKEDSLTSYFDSPSSLFHFVSQVSDKFVSTDGQGKIKIAFLAEELQEKTIEISLDSHNQAQMLQRIRSLERSFSELAKQAYRSKRESTEELQIIRKDFQRMRAANERHINDLEKKVEDYSQYFAQTFKGQIYAHKKHSELAVMQNRLLNQRSNDNEVRWAIIGPQVSLERNTVLLLKINRLDWLAFGFCEQQSIQSRNYSKFNGCGPHGSYVMDNIGWVYAQGNQSNYKQLGFSFQEEDTISLIYNPKQQLITFVSHSSWQRYELYLDSPVSLSPCIACNKEADISVLDYSM